MKQSLMDLMAGVEELEARAGQNPGADIKDLIALYKALIVHLIKAAT